jgi:type III restriction enzyme
MKIKFDASQQYQIDAVASVVDLFDGQPLNKGDFEITLESSSTNLFMSQAHSELGTGNRLILDDEFLLKNLHVVQDRNDIDRVPALKGRHFTVEMETGTGKTYVYLRTICELSRKYGFKKFIIVVPSVAIREGVLKNLEITEEHFKALYNNLEFEYFVYDSKKVNRLRQFALSNQIQILIINIDAFRKDFTGTGKEDKSNVIYRENDKLSGRSPIEFVQATNPIVIIDEPQSVDSTERSQDAIRALNPLCTLRYSATHRDLYNQVYKLDPIRAYEMRLVKQIVVSSVVGKDAFNGGYVRFDSVDNTRGIKAKITIHVNKKGEVKPERITLKKDGADLFELSNQREVYRDGFIVGEISAEPGNEFIRFNNGTQVGLGQELGGIREDLNHEQIRKVVRKHLDKELQVRGKGLKVLTLFFIDKVANYRSYDAQGRPVQGKFAKWFEESYTELIADLQYKNLLPFPLHKLHDGYFAQDKKGILKDSSESRTTAADDDAYNLIMKNKEQLLSLDEPLRFIFSHSALREGWDNPNVFQICTLNETRSATKKRQEIGRGLRLPVNQEGERVFDENINKLTVIANESYDQFARALQNEYEEDCGVTFGKLPLHAFAKLVSIVEDKEVELGRDQSEKLWNNLVSKGMLDAKGRVQPAFKPKDPKFDLGLEPEFAALRDDVVATLQSYEISRHIKNDADTRPLRINKQVFLDPEFEQLWNRIKARTTYSVEYKTEELVRNAVKTISQMPKITPVKIAYSEAKLDVRNSGVTPTTLREGTIDVEYRGAVPDVIAYLQGETELTRSTIVRILKESDRLGEFLVNPQKYMDAVAAILKRELHKLMIDGIKYEKTSDQEFSMRLFEEKEIISYLNSRLEVQHSVYDAIVYDSEIERKFAEDLDKRQDIKLFVKLPNWFTIETPIGTYNPDWALLKHDNSILYMVRETKGTKNFEKLRNSEAEKVRCGRRHFEALGGGVTFDVVTSSADV